MKKVIWLVVAVVVILIIVALTGGKGGQSGPIKIGFIGPLSGDAAALGQEMQHVVQYRIKQINDSISTSTPKFEVVYEDGKCSGADSASAFQKLTDVDGVKVIIGAGCSAETLGAAPLANDKKILMVSGVSSNPKIEDQGPFVFSVSYSDKMTGENLAKVAAASSKKIAILTEQTDFAVGIHDVFVETLKQYPSSTIVADETFPNGGTDFRAVLAKIKATNPDALVLNPNVGVTAETLIKQLAEMKTWKGFKLFSAYPYLPDASRSAAKTLTEGMTIIDVPTVTEPKFMALSSAIEAETGTLKDLGSYYTASMLDATDLVTSEIIKLGNDPVKIQQDLSTGSFSGFVGAIRFDGKNFFTFTTPGVYVVTDGTAVLQ
jgi:branched-chain amino acid transport system substrate-binding protein